MDILRRQLATIPHKPHKTRIMRTTRQLLLPESHRDQYPAQLLDTGRRERTQVKHMSLEQAATQLWEASYKVECNLDMEAFLSKQMRQAIRKEDTPSSPQRCSRDRHPCTANKVLQSEDINHLRPRTRHKASRQRQRASIT